MPSIWLSGGFGWLCPALRHLMVDVRCWLLDVPDREPSRFAAGRNGLGCWTFWRLLALVAAANRDGSRSAPELDAALPRYVPSRNALGFSPSRPNLPLNRWRSNPNRSSTPRLERTLSDLVNQAYGLTPAEIELMWQTAPPRMPIAPHGREAGDNRRREIRIQVTSSEVI
jgi:hypothetical protein